MARSSDLSISVENWRTAAKVLIREVISDPGNLEVCYCDVSLALAKPELTKESIALSSDEESTAGNTWVSTLLYTLMMDKKEKVLLPTGWLSDTVIKAAQLHIL